ncbi:hypothetical protein B0H63DRAFT_547797 [Podospora didyma]|uniref:Uncharacterized protein n=1 Tax=Podospora didyma TaxID=330526 RepID=A0AAE0KKX0_9PEZI|nr:hypothetical protein B0H63DRAFT_547797 [Podospora didyma]
MWKKYLESGYAAMEKRTFIESNRVSRGGVRRILKTASTSALSLFLSLLASAGLLLKAHGRRVLARPKTFFPVIFFLILFCIVLQKRDGYHVGPFGSHPKPEVPSGPPPVPGEHREEKLLRQLKDKFDIEKNALEKAPGAMAIYGNTLDTLAEKENRLRAQEDNLTPTNNVTSYSTDAPFIFNPYPKYNSPSWKQQHAEYVPCMGPTGAPVEDILVFKGRPKAFPEPGFGTYDDLGIDQNLCYERETRLGQYGVTPVTKKDGSTLDWDNVDWGKLQRECREKNQARFATSGPPNNFIDPDDVKADLKYEKFEPSGKMKIPKRHAAHVRRQHVPGVGPAVTNTSMVASEPRTALLLRSYTGKEYTDNDKQAIRSLITELSLRTGGEYEVFLFVHVRDESDIWSSDEAYEKIVQSTAPKEFWNITILWNQQSIDKLYTKLPDKARRVHNGQFLPVQIFMQQHRQFDYVWNWEMDSRVMGHHYDVINKLGEFAKKQPRKGLWERNERFYVPSFYGDFNTRFRATVERLTAGSSIWGAPDIPVVKPMGPKPPVPSPDQDRYEWGVGEEADLITLAPMFNVINSGWVMRNQVWGYRNDNFPWGKLPRRATIITQVRVSRKLLDIMHAEDLRGNHVASEMVTQTTALLHGLKAVYAPMPVFFDRPWDGAQLARWFNGGPKSASGGFGSAMGWGQEARFQGSSWYYRALPPQRLYNNWMGYEDTGIGGAGWEKNNGRPCLPAMILHPIKEVKPTEPGTSSISNLPY